MWKRFKKVFRNKFLKIAGAVLLAWFLIHTMIIANIGLVDIIKPADCIVVFGNKVYPDGRLSDRLKGRVDKSLELYRKGYAKKIMVSGSIQKEDKAPEGTMMKAYLISKGISSNDIIADDHGTNSYLTAINYKKLAKKNQYKSVIVVSEFYHIARIKMIFKKLGISPVYSAHADYYEWNDVPVLLREFMAFYKYLVWY